MNELDKWLKKYAEKFDDGFPMIPLGWGRDEHEIIDIIKSCIDNGKDVYELKYVEDDNELVY